MSFSRNCRSNMLASSWRTRDHTKVCSDYYEFEWRLKLDEDQLLCVSSSSATSDWYPDEDLDDDTDGRRVTTKASLLPAPIDRCSMTTDDEIDYDQQRLKICTKIGKAIFQCKQTQIW